ncbi:MAG: NPCBM/NEW2 domain-containing protein [bacterium]|nr:NPCBM/NEW2 domain-containing protein [bacterium]
MFGATTVAPAQAGGRDSAPTFELALRQGRTLVATAVTGGPGKGWEVTIGGRRQQLPGRDVLAVSGVAVQPLELSAAWLPEQEVVRGSLTGGDASGDTLTIVSPVLGAVELEVDRLAAFVPRATTSLTPATLRLPDGVDEALYVRARIGYDLLAGSLHRFDPLGVRFATDDEEKPALYRPKTFLALRIADPAPRERAPIATLLTRTGDRVGVDAVTFEAEHVRVQLEDESEVRVRLADLAALSFHGHCTYLSDLEPSDAVEVGFDGPVVHPFRRDTACLGSPLVAGDRTHGKGLGVHSRSRLSYVVPDGTALFWTRVAFDDTAAGLPLRAHATVRVYRAGKVVFEELELQAGMPPRDTGPLPVEPGETILLEVDFGKGRDLGDRVDWLTPVFLPAPTR